MLKLRCVSFALILIAGVVRAEIVTLKDGTCLEGKLQPDGNGWTIIKADGSVVDISPDDVQSMQPGPAPAVGADALDSLRRSVAELSDSREVVVRYEQFIADSPNIQPAVLDAANTDLNLWRDRLSRGLVRLGDDWVTAQERQRRRGLAQSEALPARDLIVETNFSQAQDVLAKALIDDPQCRIALYLQGYLFYQQGAWSPARQSLETLKNVMPDDAPALNNLAVVTWRLKFYVAALSDFNAAMIDSPVNKLILDNVNEALHALPEQNKQAPAVRAAIDTFNRQDASLQSQLAAQDMHRWGSSWISEQKLQDIHRQIESTRARVDSLEEKSDSLGDKISDLNDKINSNTDQMKRLKDAITNPNSSLIGGGNLIGWYDTLRSQNQKMAAQIAALTDQRQQLDAQAKELKSTIPRPPFTGVQTVFGVEGLPSPDPGIPLATTRPAAAPNSDPAIQP